MTATLSSSASATATAAAAAAAATAAAAQATATAAAAADALTRDLSHLAAISATPVVHHSAAPTHSRSLSSVSAISVGTTISVGTPPPHSPTLLARGAAGGDSHGSGSNSDSEAETAKPGAAGYIAELKGYLSKWTNYIHGWQPRYIVLRNGTLSYYKSEVDSDFGCRGAISLHKATIKSHEFDDCRIDVSVSNCMWYLRADTPEDKLNWIEVLQSYNTSHIAAQSNSHSSNSNNNNNNHGDSGDALRRHGSTVSLQSQSLSTASGGSLKRANRSLREKVHEIETFKDILFGQIDTLQRYFDACAQLSGHSAEAMSLASATPTAAGDGDYGGSADGGGVAAAAGGVLQLGGDLRTIDFKGESITFRATTSGVLTTLQHCLDIINERDDSWRKRMDKEIARRRRSEGLSRQYKDELDKSLKNTSFPGPDLEEGPHSTLPEDEFFDAVESGLDKIEEDRKLRVRLRLQSQQSHLDNSTATSLYATDVEASDADDDLVAAAAAAAINNNSSSSSSNCLAVPQSAGAADSTQPASTTAAAAAQPADAFGTGSLARQHRLWPQISEVCTAQLHHARQGVGEGDSGWQLFADEGEMRMYRREEEIDGMVVDPLKACHVVQGVSAREMCHYFFMPEYRNDWETTLEDMTILEQISPDAIVFLQTHKRIWPATQRDALFWSHMQNVRQAVAADDSSVHDAWAVCNHSIEHDSYPAPNAGKCIRLFLTVILVCQTYVRKLPAGQQPTRADLTCKITYCSTVNPGGWAPKTALRAVYKREYPKFLKRFTQYVVDQCQDKPIMF